MVVMVMIGVAIKDTTRQRCALRAATSVSSSVGIPIFLRVRNIFQPDLPSLAAIDSKMFSYGSSVPNAIKNTTR